MTQQTILQNDNEMKEFAIGVYKDEKNRNHLPTGYQGFAKSEDKNGFYGEAYVKNGKVVVVFRGTDGPKDFIGSNKDMYIKKIPTQAESALNFYYEVEAKCKKYGYSTDDITITGHSLGGSLTQYVCYVTGRKGVTFNAYGVKDMVEKFGVIRNKKVNIRNYGNINDWTFYHNLHLQTGDTYVIDTNKSETEPRKLRYHRIEDMGDIKNAEPYDIYKHHKFERESMSKDRVLVVEDVIKRKDWGQNGVFAHYFLNQAKNGYTMWEREIDKKVAGGEVYVHSYTRDDGTHVRDYYRSYPRC